MNKKQKKEMKLKLSSVEETLEILYVQESQLLEVIARHDFGHKAQRSWVQEIFITAEYICRLTSACNIMREQLKND